MKKAKNKQNEPESMLNIGVKPFITAASILLLLIIFSGILTRIIPAGSYNRVLENGRQMVVDNSFHYLDETNYPIWRWFTAPLEVFAGDNWMMVWVLSLFMIFLGGAFSILEEGGILQEILNETVKRFHKKKYILMAVLIFAMMFMAAFVGIYEALVPLVVIIVPLSLALGWDSLTGLGMSLLALSFGFAAAVTNPFTIGVAQKIADLPLFSGAAYRILFFICTYIICFFFVKKHAKKVEENPKVSPVFEADEKIRRQFSVESLIEKEGDPSLMKAGHFFARAIVIAILFMIVAGLVPAIPTDAAFPVVALLFLIGGIGAGRRIHYSPKKIMALLIKGAKSMLPGIVLIVMAMSVPHVMTRGKVMDTILFYASQAIKGTSPYQGAFYIYILTLILNFFISSASAKAFLVMPIIAPLSDLIGLTRQTAVLAFDLGDGFSNMIFPTNALLLIGLSFTVVGYNKWLRWTWKMQAAMAFISMVFLMGAVSFNFGPF